MAKLVGSVTQGSADAYAESAIVTQLSTLSTTAWVINHIMLERTSALPGADTDISVCISRGTKAALPTVDDRDVIFKIRKQVELVTSGMVEQNLVDHYFPQQEILIVEENIYLQIDSTGTSQTNVCRMSIDVSPKRVTEAQRLAILAGRIAS